VEINAMMSIGIVKSVDGPTAKVIVEAAASCCDRCEKDYCDISTSGVETEALNAVHARVGQKVRLSMKTYTYVKGALVLYALPVIALFIGALLGMVYLPAYFPGAGRDALSAAGAFVLFLVSLFPVILLSRNMEKKSEDRSVIEAILEE
jgi:sigma-E factor negative regulatory protein RseC